MQVEYKGELHTLIFNIGKVWRIPESGVVTEFYEGVEYDLTDYIEDEGWLIENKDGVQSLVHKSECKEVNK